MIRYVSPFRLALHRHAYCKATILTALALCCSAQFALGTGEWFTSRTADGRTEPVATLPDGVVLRDVQFGGNEAIVATTFPATGLPLNIPDNNPAGVRSNLPVNIAAASGGVRVSLRITHPYRGDLKVTLISPSGRETVLHDRTGGSADDVVLQDVAVAGPAEQAGTWVLFVQDLAAADIGRLDSWSLTIDGATATAALIDVAMSLSANPQGDDNGNQQGQAGSEAQDKWERIVQHFADGVFEATNGAHKIRNVRIFRSGRFASSADVVWSPLGHPHVPARGGVGEKGGRINMFEVFKDGGGAGVNYNLLGDEIGAGYTLAHEWGHYFYNLYDEYKIAATDVDVAPSIMSSQWRATSGDKRWLNFSIKNTGGGDFQNTLRTSQHRQHAASCWETLARPVADDPRNASQLLLGKRIFYPEVALSAPAANTTPRIDLPGTARSALNIVWTGAEDVYEIIIDRSGSMASDNKMQQAKTAAALLIDILPLGTSRVGLIQFDHTVQELQTIIPLTTQADKNAVKAKIAAITTAGQTAIGDAARAGLNALLAPQYQRNNRVAFLLSDGENNAGVDPLSVIPSYQQAQIPLFTFAFGNVDRRVLEQMALATRGKFYISPSSLAAITAAFQDAQAVASSSPSLAAATMSLPSGNGETRFAVDSTLKGFSTSAIFDSGSGSGNVQLFDPAGAPVTPISTTTIGRETLRTFSIINPARGNWTLRSQSATSAAKLTYTTSGTTDRVSYSAVVESVSGNTVAFPAPIVLRAKLFSDVNITGASVVAQAIAPDGSQEDVVLRDDGTDSDDVAGDGNYAALYRYRQNGTYNFKVNFNNDAARAKATYSGATFSPTTNGSVPPRIADQPITELFNRNVQLQVTTAGGTFSNSVVAANISTRMKVGTNDDVMIAGFIINGVAPKPVIIRAIGPTLAGFGVPGVLGDPELTLFNSSGQPIFSNDDWRGAQAAEIIASGRAPQDERESAMIQTLQPGSYTAIVRGKAATTGVALVEVYDLDVTANSQMANISTRGKVLINDEVMIGGFILSGGGTSKLLVRATGPTLTQFAVPGALQDTTLDLFDGNGTRFASNDDWRSTQEQAIIATGRAPLDDREAAVLSTLAAGGYTAILRGKNGSVGVGLVEAYVVP